MTAAAACPECGGEERDHLRGCLCGTWEQRTETAGVVWHRLDRGDDLAWVGRRGGRSVAVVTHLASDTRWHPATIGDGGRRHDLPPQLRLHDAFRYAELVLGDYWPAREQLELLATAEPEQLELPSPGFLRAKGRA